MSTFDAASITGLSDLAASESMTLDHGGDPIVGEIFGQFKNSAGTIARLNRDAAAKHASLKADDLMNVAGKARLLDELPGNLAAVTAAELNRMAVALDVAEARLTAVILGHDNSDDAGVREEIRNYVADLDLTPDNAGLRLVQLATNPRYSSALTGPFGQSLAARYSVDPNALRRAAIAALGSAGNDTQKRAGKALDGLAKSARRVHSLAAAGVSNTVSSITVHRPLDQRDPAMFDTPWVKAATGRNV